MNPDLERAVERLLDDRVRQGLPRYVEDPAQLTRIAEILHGALAEEPSAS